MSIIWLAVAYIIGSVPFGLIFAKVFCHVDPRTEGSGNIGTTNVARLCGKGWGVATLICDMLKGTLAVAVAMHLGDSTLLHTLTALAAIVGHWHSCFLHFKGGKAVATSIGVLIPLAFFPLLISCAVCVGVIWRSGFVSLGSLTMVTCLPVILALLGRFDLLPLALIILSLVFWSHRDNIQRLARGEEKPWAKKKA